MARFKRGKACGGYLGTQSAVVAPTPGALMAPAASRAAAAMLGRGGAGSLGAGRPALVHGFPP